MKIVVSGGAGFIGSHIVDRYVAAGHEVVVVDDLSSGVAANVNPRARLVKCDVTDPRVVELVAAEKPDVINHHAAQLSVRISVEDPVLDARINLFGILHLLQAATRAGTQRFVFASSGGTVYGDQEQFPADESHPKQPVSPYGVAKLASEAYLGCWRALHGLHWVALRYANVYGPRQNPHGEAGVVAIFCERMLAAGKKGDVFVNGDGGQTRDFVFVEDVADANLRALDTPHLGGVNIGTGTERDINEVHDILARHTGWSAPRKHTEARPGEQRRSCLDPSLAGRVLGWSPRVTLDEGLRRTVEHFRSASA